MTLSAFKNDIREPEWLAITTLGVPFEEELDVNASPGAPDNAKYRHRPIAFTGQHVDDWRPGPAPR